MALGDIQGLNYEMKPFDWSGFTQQQTVDPGVQGKGDPTLNAPHDLLADIDGGAEDLYGKYALLKNYATSMAKKGIDVDYYDFEQPGGGLAYNTYQKLRASVLNQKNKLVREQKLREKLAEAEWEGKVNVDANVDRDSTYFLDNPGAIQTTAMDDATKEANRRLGANYDRPQDAANADKLYYDKAIKDIDDSRAAGRITEAQAILKKSQLFRAVSTTPVFQPTKPDNASKYAVDRAALIKQIKGGIFADDPSAINILRQAPGVTDVKRINDGSRIGYEIQYSNGNPTFLDLTKGGAGDGEINSYLNRIEGQVNIPNELVSQFDTTVPTPQSDAPEVIGGVRDKLLKGIDPKNFSQAQDILPTLQQLAQTSGLKFDKGTITGIEIDEPTVRQWWGGTPRYRVAFHPVDKKSGKVNTGKTLTAVIEKPEDLEAIIQQNSNELAGGFGSKVTGGGQQSAPANNSAAAERAAAIKAKYGVK